MRCCASKRSTSTRSEAGAPETPRASPDEGVAAAIPAVKETSHQSIRIVDSDDEPAGWASTDPCTSDDGAARTSTSAFAEGCVAVDAREVARSIAAELLTKRAHDRRDVFSVRRSGTDASSALVSYDDFDFDPEVGMHRAESGGDTVTEPDETTSLLESVSWVPTHRAGSTREFGVNTDDADADDVSVFDDDARKRRRAVTPWTAVLLTACAVVGCALYALDPMNVAGALAGHSWRMTKNADPDLKSVESAKPAKAAGDGGRDSRDTRGRRGGEEDGGEEDGVVDDVPGRDRFVKALAKALEHPGGRERSEVWPSSTKRQRASRRGGDDRPARDSNRGFEDSIIRRHAHEGAETTKGRASRHAPSRTSKRRPETREEDAEKTSGSDASVALLGRASAASGAVSHRARAVTHRARATSHRGANEARVVGACAANVPDRDANRGRFQFEDVSCGARETRRMGSDTSREGCARVGTSHSHVGTSKDRRNEGTSSREGASSAGCRFCVLHGSAREDDEDGYDGYDGDDYLPMLDPLAWSVRYEACPRDVCVTRGLRAALCDPD